MLINLVLHGVDRAATAPPLSLMSVNALPNPFTVVVKHVALKHPVRAVPYTCSYP
jgi:hypothetical protein